MLAHDEHPHDVPERYVTSAWPRWVASAERPAICRSPVGAGRRERPLRLLVTLLAGRTLWELGYR